MKTPIANMIAEMHGKGIPVELIVSAVSTLEEAMAARAVSTGIPVDTSTIEKRRAWDRERKRRKKAERNSTGNPHDSTGIPPDSSCIVREERSLQIEVKEKKESKRDARGTRIPPDFAIDDDDRAFAASLGIPPETVEAETPQFIDYWSSIPGAKGVKLSWKATWRNRMRDLKKYLPTSRAFKARPATIHQHEREKGREILNALRDASSRTDSGLLRHDTGNGPEGVRGGVRGTIVDLSSARDRASDEPVERSRVAGELSQSRQVPRTS